MGFLKLITRWLGLRSDSLWGDSYNLQPPIPYPSTHSVIEPPTHDYADTTQFCNSPTNRSCWIKSSQGDFDIYTDYEQRWPQGVTREYWLEVNYTEIAPDGVKRIAQLVNGTYPGPLIEANWGDRLIIHVTNYLAPELSPDPEEVDYNGTTIHWHGLRQYKTTEADGVTGVTQCPIKPYDSYTYEFQATQFGHSWYHSHHGLQYPNGLYGPLLIHGPTSENWDIDAGVLTLSDWFHRNAYVIFSEGELALTLPRNSSSTVMNGHGIYPCQASDEDPSSNCTGRNGSRHEMVVQHNKKYLLHIVNTAAAMQFRFSIDNHMLDVISADFVPIQPYRTESISIGIGQRYTVVVTAKPNSTLPFPPAPVDRNFWIRTIPLSFCGNLTSDVWSTYGILRYSEDSTDDPVSKPYNLTYYTNPLPECLDVPAENLRPVVPWIVGQNPLDVQDLAIGVDAGPVAQQHGFHRWEIGPRPMWLDWANPTIESLDNSTWNPDYDVILEHSAGPGQWGWEYFIIQSKFNPARDPTRIAIPLDGHPIHLHGHDFAILAQGKGEWDTLNPRPALNYNNPPRRDVALLNADGYLVIAFRTDNPGIWLMHCHIAWHAASGFALQIVERQNEIEATIRKPNQIRDTCDTWSAYRQQVKILQDDSGI